MLHMKYNHLSFDERLIIEKMMASKQSLRSIARLLNRSPSTISRELRRNKIPYRSRLSSYLAANAHQRAQRHHARKPKRRRFSRLMKEYIRRWLQSERLSPELITVRGKCFLGDFVSHETIYQWLWMLKKSNLKEHRADRHLYTFLRHARRRPKRSKFYQNRGRIPRRVGIEDRPDVVKQRSRIGDLEIDLVMGRNHKPGLLVIVDRATLRIFIQRIVSRSANYIQKLVNRVLLPHKDWIKTITLDNDLAFARHHKITEALGAPVYFTRPYTSQDKGTVENRIGLIRAFFPKRTDFNQISDQQIERVQRIINRKKFNYASPNEKFSQFTGVALVA